MSDLISIGEFADVSRLSVKALRHYDELGLLRPASVDPSTGYRLYDWWQVPTARVIVMLRSLEMPLSEIRDVLEATGSGQPADAAAVVSAHRRRLADRLARSEEQLTAIDALLNGKGLMQYKVETRALVPQTVIGIREETTQSRFGEAVPRLLHEVMEVLERSSIVSDGPPFLVSPAADAHAPVVIHAGFPVPESTPSIGRCVVEVLAGGLAVATIHTGPYTAIEPAYQALTTWMHANGRRPSGAPREIYLTSPDVEVDESRWRTEVVWPITADKAQR